MRAARFYGAGDVRVEDVDAPQQSDTKVLVQVEWCGICGSDLNEYLRGPIAIPSSLRGPHKLTGEVLPLTLGHEVSGRVIHAPENSLFFPGQAVMVDPRHYCRTCTACCESATNCCEHLGFLGLSGGGGGLSEAISVPPHMLHALPDNTDLAAAALIEPLAVAWHAARCSGIASSKHKSALVIGGGPVGVATMYVLKAWGLHDIFLSEPAVYRRELCSDIARASFDPITDNIGLKCREYTGGGGVGFVFDCAGSQAGMEAGCDALRFHGSYINLAVPKSPHFSLPLRHYMLKELRFQSMLAYDHEDFRQVVEAFISGRFKGIERIITGRIALEDVVEQGFKPLTQAAVETMKIIVTPKKQATNHGH